jgi:hypothetical protein
MGKTSITNIPQQWVFFFDINYLLLFSFF